MYCKYCGGRLTQNSKKCAECGAEIDFFDGGQSYYDDNELDAWQSDSIESSGANTDMPKTAIIEPGAPSRKPSYSPERRRDSYGDRGNARSELARPRQNTAKKKKSFLGRMSMSTKLIMAGIASAIVLVLVVVAIYGIVAGRGTKLNYDEYKDAVVMLDKKEIKSIDTVYLEETDTLYLPVEKLLAEIGYKMTDNKRGEITFKNKEEEITIVIKLDTTDMCMSIPGKSDNKTPLELQTIKIDREVFVPAKSFMEKLGYDVGWDGKSKTAKITTSKF